MQRPVTAYFNARKRQATDEFRSKAKVLLLEQDSKQVKSNIDPSTNSVISDLIEEQIKMGTSPRNFRNTRKDSASGSATKVNNAVRNIQFDSPKLNDQKVNKINTRSRAVPSKKLFEQNDRMDIRESFAKLKNDLEAKKVLFEKKGALSPKKGNRTPKKETQTKDDIKQELSPACSAIRKMLTPDKSVKRNLSFDDIKNKINKSSRLAQLKASIERIKNCDQRLEQLQKESQAEKPHLRKFGQIQLEIPVSPQKACKSPTKMVSLRNEEHPNAVSPQRRILFEPKETPPSPIKGSPTKAPAYQRYLSLAESGTPALPLPYKYRCLAEIFGSMDTVSAMLFNRKETITFTKLKPAIQELLRRNFTMDHLAQIKTIYPSAYTFRQEKHHSIGITAKQEKYELILTPILEATNDNGSSSTDQGVKSSEMNMGPTVMLKRKRIFYDALLAKVKDEHEKFLLGLDTPMVIPKEKIMRWHPEFDVDNCKDIELSELPQPPNVNKATSAKDVLEKAMSLYGNNKQMEKAFQKISEGIAAMEDKSAQTLVQSPPSSDNIRKVDITVVDTPPNTPTTTMQSTNLSSALKGIPKALLEKVRAKQAAKALEAMTRTPNADKEAALYARLPELAKILRNIFVAERKGVLSLEFVIGKLDNSFRTKLTPNELEEHIRLLCKLLPTWTSIHNVRKIDYLKLAKDVDLNKVIKRLQILANDKVTTS